MLVQHLAATAFWPIKPELTEGRPARGARTGGEVVTAPPLFGEKKMKDFFSLLILALEIIKRLLDLLS
ncbi:hypothetical protein [Azospirillum himalayense]|uniref:hypothetical protein n=1 Tax=Azospirillum himalayense TaxID=654847 RepID=UPI00366D5836